MEIDVANQQSMIPVHQFDEKLRNDFERYRSKIFDNLTPNTKRVHTKNLRCYLTFCHGHQLHPFESKLQKSELVVEQYFDHLMTTALGHHTIRQQLSTVTLFFGVMSLPNPLKQSEILRQYINLKLKDKPAFQHQAQALTLELLNEYNESFECKSVIEYRDKVIVNLAFDGLLRGSEVANIRVEHLIERRNLLFLPKRKTDQSGKGGYAYISDKTFEIIQQYCNKTAINTGYLLRPLSPKGTSFVGDKLDCKGVLRTFKRISGILSADLNFSSHSGRIGKAVSMVEAGADDRELMQAGGWSSPVMPARYTKQARLGMGIGARLR